MKVIEILFTIPGTETKVTPEIEAPIIPKATIYQGEVLFALKKTPLVALRVVSLLMSKSTVK